MKFEKRSLDDKTAAELIELSEKWKSEGCTHGIIANKWDDLKEPLFVAEDGGKTVGYIFGHYYDTESKTSYIEIGSRCFMVDEIYVLPEYRSCGIGKELFKLLENEVKGSCDYVTLSTSTKDYKRILHFYAEELGMDFHSAFLIKPAK